MSMVRKEMREGRIVRERGGGLYGEKSAPARREREREGPTLFPLTTTSASFSHSHTLPFLCFCSLHSFSFNLQQQQDRCHQIFMLDFADAGSSADAPHPHRESSLEPI